MNPAEPDPIQIAVSELFCAVFARLCAFMRLRGAAAANFYIEIFKLLL
jgi:hypothetical protein